MADQPTSWTERLIDHLQRLHQDGDRGALAVLRRSLQRVTGGDYAVYPYIIPRLPAGLSRREEDLALLTGGLFALHPDPGGRGSFGAILRRLDGSQDGGGVERRFVALLNTPFEDLPRRLRQLVGLLRNAGIAVEWSGLLSDLRYWDHPDGFIQRRWAQDFWGYLNNNKANADSTVE